MGSQLLAAGLAAGEAPEEWNLDRPDVVSGIHRAYFDAGSDVVQTNTFGGNRVRLAETKCLYSVEEVCRAGATIAKEVQPDDRMVAGDMGPTGLSFPPLGQADEKELEDIFAEQAAALAGAGVDLLSIETMSDIREAVAAITGAKSVCDLPLVVSMTFRKTRRGHFTIMGDPLLPSLQSLLDSGASAVGANCTLSSNDMCALAQEVNNSSAGIIIIQPNAGEPQIVTDGDSHEIHYPEGPDEFASNLRPAIQAGVDIIGGCCGTEPGHISALARMREKTTQ